MKTHYYFDTNIRYKQINSTQLFENRNQGCCAALQPEYFTISILEDHFTIK